MHEHEKINYLELPVKEMNASKEFFSQVFAWTFIDYGDEYCAFSDAGVEGGFYKSKNSVSIAQGSALIVFYSQDIDATQLKIEKAGGKIVKPIFSFPGGQRFHFRDPSENEFAVWSEA